MSENENIICKVVLIGESGVGKTSIISRFVENEFYSSLESTIGASFSTKSIYVGEEEGENNLIKLEIWDTSGITKYRSLTKFFCKNSPVCVLVYDITKRSSFEEIKNYWIHEVTSEASNTSMFLIYFLIYFLF